MKKFVLLLSVTFYAISIWSQSPTISWQMTHGGNGIDYRSSVEKTPDGGYIIAGGTTSPSGDITNNNGDYDFWKVKLTETIPAPCPALVAPTIRIFGDTTLCQGGQVYLNTYQQGGARYQWFKNDIKIPGATDTLYIANTSGLYKVRTYSSCNNDSTTTRDIRVTVKAANIQPTITAASPLIFCNGDSVILTSSVNSGNQWYVNNYPLYGATGKTYSAKWSGVYTVRATDSCGAVTSNSLTITVAASPLKVETPYLYAIGDTTFCSGKSVTLFTGYTSGVTYQWFRNGIPIANAIDTSLRTSEGGIFFVRAFSTCSGDSATSRNIQVTVKEIPPNTPLPTKPTITASGLLSFCNGDSIILTSSATTGNKWYLYNFPMSNATGKNLVVTGSGSYKVSATNGCDEVFSDPVTIEVAFVPSKIETPYIYVYGDTTVCAGKNVVLTTPSYSYTGVKYKWRLDGYLIPGAIDTFYTAAQSGLYSVVTYSDCSKDSAVSRAVKVTVNSLPVKPILSASGPLSFCSGDSVVLNSSNIGGNSWYKNNQLISEITGSTYVVRSNGSYRVLTTNSCGTVASDSIKITVTTGPIKPDIPYIYSVGDTSFCKGNSVLLKVAPRIGVSYKWFRNGGVIPGAVDTSYRALESGLYAIKAYSNCRSDSTLSKSISISVLSYPDTPIVSANGPVSFCNGSSVTLTSTTAANYQWYKDGISISGATGRSYIATTSGSYKVYTTNTCGNNASVPVTVSVSNTPLTLSSAVILNSGDTTFCQGRSVRLSTWSRTGVNYQWFKDGIAINGAKDTAYTASVNGTYNVRVYNTCNLDSVTSKGIKIMVLTIPDTPRITANGPLSFCNGNSVTLTASSAANYQWYNSTALIGGATSQSYRVTGSGDYRVYTSNSCGTNASTAIKVTVSETPATLTAPIFALGDTTFCQGGSIKLFTWKQYGVTYQWFRDGIKIPGATDTAYTTVSNGMYSVKRYNTCNLDSLASKSIRVTVLPFPDTPRVSSDGPLNFCTGGRVTLTAGVAGNYQWYRDNSPITGATFQQLAVTTAGRYKVRTQNDCAAVMSNEVVVSVTAPPSAPVISSIGNILRSSATMGNQWYFNGVAIVGATSQQYTAVASGGYTVRVTNNGCSTVSANFPFTLTKPAVVSCPADIIITAPSNQCAAVVSNINPSIVPAGISAGVRYMLSGATTGSGTGSLSGKSFNVGVTNVTYFLDTDTTIRCRFTVTVRDLEAPIINTFTVSTEKLWPPDHKMVDILLNYNSSDNCGSATICKISISSNEPQNGLGDGDMDNDWEIVNNNHIRLRAERSGNGDGRIYTITLECSDAPGNVVTKTATVNVPKAMLESKTGPNPSTTQFTISTKSIYNEPLIVRVLDASGNLIEVKKNVAANSTLVLGRNYEPGIYYIELIQGSNKEVIRVIKLIR